MIIKIIISVALVAVAAMGRRALARRQDGIENVESGCAGCFWEERCNSKGGVKLCEDDTNEWEDAPWVML